jgi:predicted nucleic acid-binding Zn ribbon protein
VDGERVEPAPLAKHQQIMLWVSAKTGKVYETVSSRSLLDEIIVDLWRVLRQSPFPFRRCLVCSTVFVWTKRQKFCSPQCKSRSQSSASNPKRRLYMLVFYQFKQLTGAATSCFL